MKQSMIGFVSIAFMLAASVCYGVPNDEQKAALKKQCVESGIIKKLIDKKAKNCPESIKKVKPTDKNTKPIACLLTNKNDPDMTPTCRSAAQGVYEAIPRFFRPSLK